ncbi:hypothetical protein GCM10014715_72410 [Streptomyces spiralis]|uniref:Uncharacterized protein n=1 Tax=Streptomyces spiralis TaxID=66376 RepID=A0A919E2Y1_9ACTN|nr:hypothetical protein GCM10014715_72410 [Streptomyces spiralis]
MFACWANYAVDRPGTPLAVTLTGSYRHDSTQFLSLLDAVTPIRGLRGRPRRKPRRLDAPSGLRSASSVTAASGDGAGHACEGETGPHQVWGLSRSLSAAPTSGQCFWTVSRKARSTGE